MPSTTITGTTPASRGGVDPGAQRRLLACETLQRAEDPRGVEENDDVGAGEVEDEQQGPADGCAQLLVFHEVGHRIAPQAGQHR
ncbi:MAG TPA: hypothetical protein VIV01_16035, partial [Hyphomicrobiaceae bacterium]